MAAAKKYDYVVIDGSLYKMPVGIASTIRDLALQLHQAQKQMEKLDFYEIEQKYIAAVNDLKKKYPPIQKQIYLIATV